uniref:Uncharacterized protein n=1 Tax=Opuntia streptacantha TaxID=393608 RepID=A0A7C9DQI6_OPUST
MIREPLPKLEVSLPPAKYCLTASYTPNMAALPGTSRARVGTKPLKRPLTPASEITCLATSIGPPYFTATVAVPAPAKALWACNLHLTNSVGQAKNATAAPAPAPATTCWPTVRGTPGSDLKRASICPLTEKRTALKAATVASGAPIPLYKPRGPSAANVCLTASIAPENLGGWPGSGVGWLWSFTLMVSKGCPTIS